MTVADADTGMANLLVYVVLNDALATVHDADDGWLAVAPGAPAERLSGLGPAARTRDHAGTNEEPDPDAVAAFIADGARIEAIRERARTEAEARAAEWGLTDQLADWSRDEDSDGAGSRSTVPERAGQRRS